MQLQEQASRSIVSVERDNDIHKIDQETLKVTVDGATLAACSGESVLGLLFTHGHRVISKNDRGMLLGASCGMGICHACTVIIDGRKKRACRTLVRDGMNIRTCRNLGDILDEEAPHEIN